MVMVAICDDEKKICAELETALTRIFGEHNVEAEIDVFYSGEELCRHLEKGTHYDLIYLDIEFAKEELNGVEVGHLSVTFTKTILFLMKLNTDCFGR